MNDNDLRAIEQGIEDWLNSRPLCVRRLACEFPPGARITAPDGVFVIIGYTDDDELLITPEQYIADYDAAVEHHLCICASHLRPIS